jgi:O-acetyl-ADP-ribose deacetylase (regulator of RNase III)
MPYGKPVDLAGVTVDFDNIYRTILSPTIEALGLDCVRCDEEDEAGHIHRRMFQQLWKAEVAVADLSLLNPNVFYELGVRHALRRSVTVLIRRKGTDVPFNVGNLSVIEYDENDAAGLVEFRSRLARFIQAGLQDGHTDNVVSEVLSLRISDTPQPITLRQVFRHTLRSQPGKTIKVITGDLREIHGIDIWVNSENTNMQMARFYEPFVSSVIRYEGAEKSATGRVTRDTIQDALHALMDGESSVPPAQVLATTAGQLQRTNGVRQVFHVAAVAGTMGVGYVVIERVERCVTNALKLAHSPPHAGDGLRSILFPLLGISTPLRSPREAVEALFDAAIGYLTNYPSSTIDEVYFLAWTAAELDLCLSILAGNAAVEAVAG